MSVDIDSSQVEDLEHLFEKFPDIARQAMSIALNETARGPALKAAKRNIMAQINFPEGYLDTRVEFKKAATPYNLEARIVGRDRPTSLARFAPPGTPVAGRAPRELGRERHRQARFYATHPARLLGQPSQLQHRPRHSAEAG